MSESYHEKLADVPQDHTLGSWVHELTNEEQVARVAALREAKVVLNTLSIEKPGEREYDNPFPSDLIWLAHYILTGDTAEPVFEAPKSRAKPEPGPDFPALAGLFGLLREMTEDCEDPSCELHGEKIEPASASSLIEQISEFDKADARIRADVESKRTKSEGSE